MSVFALLDLEGEVQMSDKTRFDASKSFASKAVNDLTSITITPGVGSSAVEVMNPDPSERYLDWVFPSFAIDIDSTNNQLKFSEGGSTLTATLTNASYSLSSLCSEIKTQMDAAGALTYTVTVNSDSEITIASTGNFSLVECELLDQLFFDVTEDASTSHVSDMVEYGTRKVVLTATNGTDTDTQNFYIKVYSVAGDRLFCSDKDLTAHQSDIMKWVSDGRSSYKNVIRRSQSLIIAWLDEKGYVNAYGDKFTKHDIIDLEEVRQWSIFQTLKLIMLDLHNVTDDVFEKKAKDFSIQEEAARNRAILRIDVNKDGTADATEGLSISSGSLFRR